MNPGAFLSLFEWKTLLASASRRGQSCQHWLSALLNVISDIKQLCRKWFGCRLIWICSFTTELNIVHITLLMKLDTAAIMCRKLWDVAMLSTCTCCVICVVLLLMMHMSPRMLVYLLSSVIVSNLDTMHMNDGFCTQLIVCFIQRLRQLHRCLLHVSGALYFSNSHCLS